MPTNIHTLARQQAPAKLLTDSEFRAVNEAARWPLDFGRINGCTGNCVQGRFCDCQADIEEPAVPPMNSTERAWLLVLLGVSSLASLAALVWFVPMVWEAVRGWL